MVLRKSLAYFISSLILLILFFLFFTDYKDLRNFINVQYLKFKEFVFLLNNAERKRKLPLTETAVRSVLERYGLELKRISEITNGYEVEVKEVSAKLLPRIIKELENYGTLNEFEAVDNTGKGKFFLRFKIIRS